MPGMLLAKALKPSVCILFLAIILCSKGVSAAEKDLNFYGGYGPDVICVYPVSGPYNLLQRLLFYVLLVFAVLCRRQKWLVFGALASAMSFSGAAALHGLFLASPARKEIDLDIYGIFTVTSSGAMLTAPLLNWSSTLIWAEKRKRWIVIIWGVILLLGAIFSASAIHVNGAGFVPPQCIPPSEAASFDGSLFKNPTADCLYACAPQARLFRAKYDVMAWPNYLNRPRDITSIFLPATIIYVLAWIFIEILFRTVCLKNNKIIQFMSAPPAAQAVSLHPIRTLVQVRDRQKKNVHPTIQPISAPLATSSSCLPGQPGQPDKPRPRWAVVVTHFHIFLMFAHFAAFAVNVVMCEYRMMRLPSNEQPYEIGQWISWISVALVVVAQLLNRYLKLRWRTDEKKWASLHHGDEEMALGRHRWRFSVWQDQHMSNRRDQGHRWNDVPDGMKMIRSDSSGTLRRNSF
ncbi:hypothetical protein ACJ72_06646 [Emergomyces africanus]|uniref:Integral membrane protein n=1 Tax=Emergomyces africanus TaxID=1955775 RepID=A0A1B7NQI2_9EURO|nr:hypothetical protein ACJ72_06646 [Emergomyces africanus]